MSVFTVEIAPTSNPNISKFVLNSFITKNQSFEFKSAKEAQISPLATMLFQFPFVQTVFLSQNFIAIEKSDNISWEMVSDSLAEMIVEYLNSGRPVLVPEERPKKVPTSVYAESTPNPAVMKFITNRLLVEGTVEFKHVSESRQSPLAMELFNLPFVKEVFLHKNFISITKFDMISWEEITMEIREFLRSFLESGKAILSEESPGTLEDTVSAISPQPSTSERTPFETKIASIIEEYVLPAVAEDGGNIHLKSFDPETKTVNVILQGACSGCPSSTVTLKNGIERLLKQMLGEEVGSVEAING